MARKGDNLLGARHTLCEEIKQTAGSIVHNLINIKNKMDNIGDSLGISETNKWGAADFLMKSSGSSYEIDQQINKLRDLCIAIATIEKVENEE